MKLVMLSGTTGAKAAQLADKLLDLCKARGMAVEIVTANFYKDELQAVEDKEKPAAILVVGTNVVAAGVPSISGMPLLYPWMGMDKMMEEIETQYKKMSYSI